MDLGGVELGVARRTRAPEHNLRGRPLHQRIHERERGGAERALGGHAADQPMGAAATGAAVDLAVAIDRVIAADLGVEGLAAGLEHMGHQSHPLQNALEAETGDKPLGFMDGTVAPRWRPESGHAAASKKNIRTGCGY